MNEIERERERKSERAIDGRLNAYQNRGMASWKMEIKKVEGEKVWGREERYGERES